MNGVDKRSQTWVMIGRSSLDHSKYCKKKCLYVMLVLAVCVCACSCVGVSISYVQLLKFEGEAMVGMVPRQCFHITKCACFAV